MPASTPLALAVLLSLASVASATLPYPITDTHQSVCYDADGPIPCPEAGSAWSGQDAQFEAAQNDDVDQGDGIIQDRATGLQWSQADSGRGMDWPAALAYVRARNAENYLGHDDWRLPNAKELQSLVDYRRGPDISGGPAIDPHFQCSRITDEAGKPDYACDWTGTTHRDDLGAVNASFGRAMGGRLFAVPAGRL